MKPETALIVLFVLLFVGCSTPSAPMTLGSARTRAYHMRLCEDTARREFKVQVVTTNIGVGGAGGSAIQIPITLPSDEAVYLRCMESAGYATNKASMQVDKAGGSVTDEQQGPAESK